MKTSSPKASDWILTISTGAGLITPYLLPLNFAILITGKIALKIQWKRHHTYLFAAIIWAIGAYILDNKSNIKALLPYLYYWSLPFLLATNRVDRRTVETFSLLLFGLLFIDVLFNLAALTLGNDPLGRTLDLREGTFGKRLGGLFAHSFYSGSISICALTASLNNKKYRWITAIALINLFLAGSWRLIVAGPLIAILLIRWKNRSKVKIAALIATASIIAVLSTIATSNTAGLLQNANESNDFRIFAWTNSIQNIINAPLLGNAFPNQQDLEGRVNEEVIVENFISESWYLSTASTFGLPYMLLMSAALFSAIFRNSKLTSSPATATLLPFIAIDLTYGEFILGTLAYTWVWILISEESYSSKQSHMRGTHVAKRDDS